MAGTYEGGMDASKTIKRLYGKDFYRRIGAMGGRASSGDRNGGFKPGSELASSAGRKGGSISRRKSSDRA